MVGKGRSGKKRSLKTMRGLFANNAPWRHVGFFLQFKIYRQSIQIILYLLRRIKSGKNFALNRGEYCLQLIVICHKSSIINFLSITLSTMKFLMNISKPFIRNMRVYLSRCHIFVAQELLDASQVCAARQQVCCICVSQSMRRDFF